MDKSDFMHFVNSFRWHCTILMKTTRLNGEFLSIRKKKHLTGKIDGFNDLATLFEQLYKSGTVSFN